MMLPFLEYTPLNHEPQSNGMVYLEIFEAFDKGDAFREDLIYFSTESAVNSGPHENK